MNKVILMGRLTKEPEIKYTIENLAVTNYTLAVDRPYKKEKKEADFIHCVTFGKSAEFVSKYFQKGQKVCIVGRLQVSTWEDKEGHKRNVVKVITEEHFFAESKREKQEQTNNGFYPAEEIADSDMPF